MPTLTHHHTFVHLDDDLRTLTFGNGDLRLTDHAPFRIAWKDRLVTPDNILSKTVSASGDDIRLTFADFRFAARFPGHDYCRPDRAYTPDFRLTVTLRLADDELIVRVSDIRVPSPHELWLTLAQGLFSFPTSQTASLILPQDYGIRVDFPRQDYRTLTLVPSSSLSLPVHGLFTPQGGLGLWCDDPDRDVAISVNQDATRTAHIACRLSCCADTAPSRELRLRLFPAGSDFRDLARWARARRQASGRFRTLAQKMADNPEVAHLPGAVFWKHNVFFGPRPEGVRKSHSLYVARPDWNENEGLPNNWTAEEVLTTAHDAGFDRVAICSTGWNRDGFDAGYPAKLPPNPSRGTPDDIRAARELARQLSPGYSISVHDNYIDAYPASEQFRPDDMLQETPGVPRATAIWRGGVSHTLCSTRALEFARRDLPRIAELFGRGCIYLDVSACVPMLRCHAPAHPLTRAQDCENRRALFSLAKRLFGALAVEGCGTDAFADLIDIGAYGGLHTLWQPAYLPSQPVPVPLWQMVYHDSVLNYFGEGYNAGVHGSEYRLYQALYTLLPTAFDRHAQRLSHELRSAFTQPMTDFIDLRPRSVQVLPDGSAVTSGAAVATYGDGTRVVANFDDEPLSFEGHTIPPRDYLILRKAQDS